jgi:Bacterial pre-peptidase C-terminal domain
MTFRVAFPALVCATALALALGPGSAKAAAPSAGASNPSLAWAGQFFAAPVLDPTLCLAASLDPLNATCDHLALDVPAAGIEQVAISWADPANDFDLYVYDAAGNPVADSTGAGGTSEKLSFAAAPGRYEVRVVPFFVFAGDYRGSATWSAGSKPFVARKRFRLSGGGRVRPVNPANLKAILQVDVREQQGSRVPFRGKIRYEEKGFTVRTTAIDFAQHDANGFTVVTARGACNGIPDLTITFDGHDNGAGTLDQWEVTCEDGFVSGGNMLEGDLRFRVETVRDDD